MEEKDAYLQIEQLLGRYEDVLTRRELDIVRLRCGLLEGRRCTREEVAMIMGVSRERIGQIESKIVRILRRDSLRHREKIRGYYGQEGAE